VAIAGALAFGLAAPAAPARGIGTASLPSAFGPLAPGASQALGWGSDSKGQLGNGTTEASFLLPVAASGLSEVTAVAAGEWHSLALLSNGTVEAWGENETGELGDGTTTNKDVPVQVGGLSEVTAIAAGEKDSFALLKNGTVMAWGYNGYRLGIGLGGPENCPGPGSCSRKPVLISGLQEVTAIATGGDHSLALLKNGTVMAWGRGQLGELGDGSTELSAVPVAVTGLSEVVGIAAGSDHSLALLKNGKVMAWGGNYRGQLGTGTTTGPETCGGTACSTKPVEVSGITEAAALAAGSGHSLTLLKGGTVKAWGYNHSGQLGNGTTENSDLPVAVSGLSEVTGIAGGYEHSLARLGSGSAEAWGEGDLGDGTMNNSAIPVAVKGVREVAAVSGGRLHSLAVGALIPVPTVTKVEPNQGRASGGTSVTITGTNLLGATSVKFGSTAAASFTVHSETSITAVSPAGTGTVDITVAIPGAESPTGAADQFSYAPAVTGVEPRYGPASGATSVTIIGSNFNEVTAVKFGAASAASFKVESETKITAVSPSGVGAVDVTVTSAGGTSAAGAADQFSYSPSVTGLEPSYGPKAGGTSVTISGTNFSEVTAVRFGSTNAKKYTVNSTTSITATSPAGAGGPVDVTVTTAGGTSATSTADQFSYGPTIAKIEPTGGTGEGGTLVTVTGANLTGATGVKFGSTNATTFAVNSPTSLNAVSPGGGGTVDITVTTPEGTSPTSSSDQFKYEGPPCAGAHNPVVTAVEPSSGPAESSVTIKGEHFFEVICGDIGNSVKRVIFGAEEASWRNSGVEGRLTAVAPVGTGTVDVRVEMQNGATSVITVTGVDQFTYTKPVPSVTKLKPDHGPPAGGTSVTVTGTNLLGATAVKFGSTAATSFTVNSRQSITAVAPAGTGIVDVTVTTPEGTSATNAGDRFTYGQPPPIVETGPAYYVTASSATLYAHVNPDGAEVSECKLEYGTTTAYGSSAACTPSPGSGESPVEVSAALTGLSAGTTYHYRVSATNTGGTSKGSDATFSTPSPATVKTEAASSIGTTAATLNASVNPNGQEVTECKLEYGTTTAYGSSAPCSPLRQAGESPVAVSASVSGLSANTTYHFRASAKNAGGTSLGEDRSFTTLPPASPPTATTTAAGVTRTLATLNGTVNPNASTVSDCHFDYGATTAYGSTAPCASLPGSGESAVAVAALAGNLSPSTTYHFRVSATNANGTSAGSDQTFTTLTALPPPHWYKNAMKVPLGEKSNLIGWGTLTLESSAGTTTCHTAQAANVENTAGAARKEVVLFAAWECKPIGGSCTGGEQRATPRHLPWQGTQLEEGVEGSGEFREEGWGIELNLECFKGGVNTNNMLFKTGPVAAETGTFTPRWLNGTTATKPSEASFDLSSGHLDAEVEKAGVQGTTKGKLKFVGYQDNASTPLITIAKP
jgi:alpha-tubulin suppressor-like RCC1 family protein/phosphodiesterase/alkaline phosphatase D-like protein